MWRWIIITLIVISAYTAAKAQQPAMPSRPLRTAAGDTIRHLVTEKDSLKIYKDIHKLASRHKATLWLYKFVFNDPQKSVVKPVTVTKSDSVKVQVDEFTRYDRAIIRKVEIITFDPFGTSLTDSVRKPQSLLKSAGNGLHIKSTRLTIRNQLLFKRGQQLDPLILRENERILRQSAYVRDAMIKVRPVNENNDSVDVIVLVRDRWSIAGDVGLSTSTSRLSVTEKNFLGLSHQLSAQVHYNIPDNTNYRFSGSYTVPYIRNTFVTGSAFYAHSHTHFRRGASFSRPFFSPLAKWSYGLSGTRENTVQSFALNDTSWVQHPHDYYRYDGYLGHSFQILKGRSAARRTTKLVTSIRCTNTHFLRRAPFDLDTLMLNQHVLFPIASIGLTNQGYYKDINIYKFGEAEYVPEGRVLEFTGGYRMRELAAHYYGGIRTGLGNHIDKIGYVSGMVGYGAFYRNGRAEDGVFNIDFTYFSDSWRWRKWTGRQFFFFRSASGFNRARPERVSFNNERALYGFRSDVLSGYRKAMVNTVAVTYIPYSVIGFRFAAIAFAGMGMISSKGGMLENPVYQAYGVGVLMRNEHLVFNTFMVSFGIYPNVPGKGTEYKFNPISTYNFGFHDFMMGTPDVIPYR